MEDKTLHNIKIGDWCYNPSTKETFQVEEVIQNVEVHEDPWDFRTPKVLVTELVSNKLESIYRADEVTLIVKGFRYD